MNLGLKDLELVESDANAAGNLDAADLQLRDGGKIDLPAGVADEAADAVAVVQFVVEIDADGAGQPVFPDSLLIAGVGFAVSVADAIS